MSAILKTYKAKIAAANADTFCGNRPIIYALLVRSFSQPLDRSRSILVVNMPSISHLKALWFRPERNLR